MDNRDIDRIIERYNERIDRYGHSIEALASGTEERRNIRFEILRQIGIQNEDRILDLGCGYGDFYTYLVNQNLEINYTGVDINERIISQAKVNFPEILFITTNFLDESFNNVFDYIVSTSSFNLKLNYQNNYDFVETLLKKCFKLACKGVAVDFLSSYVDYKGNPNEAFYYNPEKVFSIAKSITKCVILRHDYPLFEFCIYLYPSFKGWNK